MKPETSGQCVLNMFLLASYYVVYTCILLEVERTIANLYNKRAPKIETIFVIIVAHRKSFRIAATHMGGFLRHSQMP